MWLRTLKRQNEIVYVFFRDVPTSDHSDEEIDEFYEQLDSEKQQAGSQDILIVMGDWNQKMVLAPPNTRWDLSGREESERRQLGEEM